MATKIGRAYYVKVRSQREGHRVPTAAVIAPAVDKDQWRCRLITPIGIMQP